MTINIAKGLGSAETSVTVQVPSGQYLIAANGNFSAAASVQIYANIGVATGTPLTGAVFTEGGVKILWLPDCTVYATVAGGDGDTDVNVSMSLASQKIVD